MKKIVGFVCFFFLLLPSFLIAQQNKIFGKIIDAQTKQPLAGANISIENTAFGTISDEKGEFSILNLPKEKYSLRITFIGYKPFKKEINLAVHEELFLNVQLESTPIEGESLTVVSSPEYNKAIQRETPIPFTTLLEKEISNIQTTGDFPELIKNKPGIWTSSAGLGESEVWIRGFSSNKIQFLVNGIIMNEAGDQNIHWSNWAGLAGAANFIQIQRGPGFSLNGSNAFGGTVLIETMKISAKKETIFRFSVCNQTTMGVKSGPLEGKVANGFGTFDPKYSPKNYTYSIRHNTGPLMGGKLNLSFFIERKAGDSYIKRTDYDGYAFGFELYSNLSKHNIRFSFLGAPQMHNRAYTLQDMDLLNTLGHEYNRKNHEWQNNNYFKPLWLFSHVWNVSKNLHLTNNIFFSLGKGSDQSLVNGSFDTETGEVAFQPVSYLGDISAFGHHGNFLFQNYGIVMFDYAPFLLPDSPALFMNEPVGFSQVNFFTEHHGHSWQNRTRRDHKQFGYGTNLQYQINPHITMTAGIDLKQWFGHKSSEVWKIVVNKSRLSGNQSSLIEKAQNLYDYDTKITTLTNFGKISIKPFTQLTLQSSGQYYYTQMQIEENPIYFFDFGSGQLFDFALRTSADQTDQNHRNLFSKNDYSRSFSFFTPTVGMNLNLSKSINVFANYSMAKKEPCLYDWYDPYKGPYLDQLSNQKLKPESVKSFDVGIGYSNHNLNLNMNYYNTKYKNKIETVLDFLDQRTTMNAGSATYRGIEFAITYKLFNFDFNHSFTFSENRWNQMNLKEIFGINVEDIVGKVVPFSPERIVYHEIGYTYNNYHFMLSLNFWDRYFGTYTNEYVKNDGTIASSELPYFFDLGAQFNYSFEFEKINFIIKFDVRNITNRAENFFRAQYTIDYTRNDDFAGKYNLYVLQAPLFHAFVTTEIHF